MTAKKRTAGVDLAKAHATSDPTGYAIAHERREGVVVALILTRLSDLKEVGRYGSREELDAAVEKDRKRRPEIPSEEPREHIY